MTRSPTLILKRPIFENEPDNISPFTGSKSMPFQLLPVYRYAYDGITVAIIMDIVKTMIK